MPRDPTPKTNLKYRPYNQVPCQICGVKVKYQNDVERHMMIHAQNADELKTPCPFEGCNHRSRQKTNLVNHAFTMHDVRVYCCQIPRCTHCSMDESSLEAHELESHGIEPGTARPRPLIKPRISCAKANEKQRNGPARPDVQAAIAEPSSVAATTNAPSKTIAVPGCSAVDQFNSQPGSSIHNFTQEAYQHGQYGNRNGLDVSSIPGCSAVDQFNGQPGSSTHNFTQEAYQHGQYGNRNGLDVSSIPGWLPQPRQGQYGSANGLGVSSIPGWLPQHQGQAPSVSAAGTSYLIQEEAELRFPQPITVPQLWNGPLQEILSIPPSPQLFNLPLQETFSIPPSPQLLNPPLQETIAPSALSITPESSPSSTGPLTPSSIDDMITAIFGDVGDLLPIAESSNSKTSSVGVDPNFLLDMDTPIDFASFFSTSPELVDPLLDFGIY